MRNTIALLRSSFHIVNTDISFGNCMDSPRSRLKCCSLLIVPKLCVKEKKYIISGAHAFIRVAFIADFSLARVATPNNPSAKRADDNRLYKTTLPPDIDNRSGRQGIREGRVVIGHGPESLQPFPHEVDVQLPHRVHAEV